MIRSLASVVVIAVIGQGRKQQVFVAYHDSRQYKNKEDERVETYDRMQAIRMGAKRLVSTGTG